MSVLEELESVIKEREAELDALMTARDILVKLMPTVDKPARRERIAASVTAKPKPSLKRRRKHSEEYKRRIAKECRVMGRGGVTRMAAREGLSQSLLYGWLKQYTDDDPDDQEEERSATGDDQGGEGNA